MNRGEDKPQNPSTGKYFTDVQKKIRILLCCADILLTICQVFFPKNIILKINNTASLIKPRNDDLFEMLPKKTRSQLNNTNR